MFFIYLFLLGEADKTHLIDLVYGVSKSGLVGAAVLFPTFHTYLGDNATDCTLFVSSLSAICDPDIDPLHSKKAVRRKEGKYRN